MAFVVFDSYLLLRESAIERYFCEELLFRRRDMEVLFRSVSSPEVKGKVGEVATKAEHSSINWLLHLRAEE